VLFDNEFCLNVKSVRSLKIIWKLRMFIKNQIRDRKKEKIIVHSHLTYPFFFTVVATIGLNVTLFYTEHNSYNRRREYKWFRYVEKMFYKKYHTIICISEGVREALLKWVGQAFSNKTTTINNGARLFE